MVEHPVNAIQGFKKSADQNVFIIGKYDVQSLACANTVKTCRYKFGLVVVSTNSFVIKKVTRYSYSEVPTLFRY